MTENITKYFKLVRFAHTVFCLPFALCGFFLGVKSAEGGFTWILLIEVLLLDGGEMVAGEELHHIP